MSSTGKFMDQIERTDWRKAELTVDRINGSIIEKQEGHDNNAQRSQIFMLPGWAFNS